MADPRSYSDEDIQAIIQRALDQQGAAKGDLTHADLLSIGQQIGVSPDALEHAAHDVFEARRTTDATRRVTSSRRRWLAAHAAVFVVINALLFTVNALTTPGEWWFLFSAVFWGLALAAHAAFSLGASVSPKRLQRERARIEAETGALAPRAGHHAAAHPQFRVTDAKLSPEATAEAPPESAEPNRSARS